MRCKPVPLWLYISRKPLLILCRSQVPPTFFRGSVAKEKHRFPMLPCGGDRECSGFPGQRLPASQVASRGRPAESWVRGRLPQPGISGPRLLSICSELFPCVILSFDYLPFTTQENHRMIDFSEL